MISGKDDSLGRLDAIIFISKSHDIGVVLR
jgi:hypothetical protein